MITLLQDSLKVDVYFEQSDSDFDDDICLSFMEKCPDEEKLFRFDETNIFMTAQEACQLITELKRAIATWRDFHEKEVPCIDK